MVRYGHAAWPGCVATAGLILLGCVGVPVALAQDEAPGDAAGAPTVTAVEPPDEAAGQMADLTVDSAAGAESSPAPLPIAETPPRKPSRFPVVEYFIRGGEWMWPILICSVLALAVIIYKLWEFWRLRSNVDELIVQTEELAHAGRHEEALTSLEDNPSPAAAVLRAALSRRGQERVAVREAMDNAGQAQLGTLESALPTLSTIASIAPLLGFLGTVTGMIEAFSRIEEVGLGDPNAVAAGISKALITTASGLIVAIPTYAAYNYFATRVKRFSLEMERVAAHGVSMATQQENEQ